MKIVICCFWVRSCQYCLTLMIKGDSVHYVHYHRYNEHYNFVEISVIFSFSGISSLTFRSLHSALKTIEVSEFDSIPIWIFAQNHICIHEPILLFSVYTQEIYMRSIFLLVFWFLCLFCILEYDVLQIFCLLRQWWSVILK